MFSGVLKETSGIKSLLNVDKCYRGLPPHVETSQLEVKLP